MMSKSFLFVSTYEIEPGCVGPGRNIEKIEEPRQHYTTRRNRRYYNYNQSLLILQIVNDALTTTFTSRKQAFSSTYSLVLWSLKLLGVSDLFPPYSYLSASFLKPLPSLSYYSDSRQRNWRKRHATRRLLFLYFGAFFIPIRRTNNIGDAASQLLKSRFRC